jgi:hypothetical protein
MNNWRKSSLFSPIDFFIAAAAAVVSVVAVVVPVVPVVTT